MKHNKAETLRSGKHVIASINSLSPTAIKQELGKLPEKDNVSDFHTTFRMTLRDLEGSKDSIESPTLPPPLTRNGTLNKSQFKALSKLGASMKSINSLSKYEKAPLEVNLKSPKIETLQEIVEAKYDPQPKNPMLVKSKHRGSMSNLYEANEQL